MKPSLTCAIALLTFADPLAAQQKPVGDRIADALHDAKRETRDIASAAARKAREGWKKTKAYLSEDPVEHRTGAARRLEELAREIADVKTRSAETSVGKRPHFQTRLLALSQQLDHVQGELARLSNLKSQSGYGAARKRFDASLDLLERAIDLAEDELSAAG